ncbi:MAG TPA: DUF3572 domain-containing protein [Rhizomicrobium sp.]
MIAIRALAFLAGREDDLLRFMSLSGADPSELRERAGDPAMLGAVLNHLLSDDALLAAFCSEAGLTPQDVHHARYRLVGE